MDLPPEHPADEIAQLHQRVYDLTAALAAANEELHQERADRRGDESRLIVDSIPGLVALLTAAGEVEVVNPQLLDYFGQPLEELKQWGTNDTIHPEDLPHVIDVFSRSIASGSPYQILQRFRRSDGLYRWFTNRGFPVRDANGRIVRWCVLLTDIDERKRAEDALRASERESRLVVDTIPGLVAILTPSGDVEVMNQRVVEYCGRPLEELKQWASNDTIHPEDLPRATRLFAQQIAAGEPLEWEARIRRRDGAYRWFQLRGLPLYDAASRIARWYLLLTDIDDLKLAEDALREREREFRLLVETIPALVWRGTPEGELDYLNERAVQYLGHTAQNLSGGRWIELVHPDHGDETVRRWLHSATTGSSYDDIYKLRRADGQYRWIQSVGDPFHDGEGRIAHWYGVIIDIDDQKRAEAELRRAYDSFAEAQRLSKTGSFITDLVGDDHNWSEESFRIFDFDPATKVSVQRIREVIHPDDLPSFESVIARGMTGEDVNFGFRILTAEGAVKHVRGVAHVIEQVAGRPMFVGALQDVTESMVAEEALNKARAELAHVARITTLSTLTASIAHEVNQPLSGIMTNASTCLRMLDAIPPDVDGARETARRTIRDSQRASDVVARLRALFSRKEFTLEPLDLNEATREVVALSLSELHRNRVIVQSELADDLPALIGDRIQLQQVILNLLRNASDAMAGVEDRPRQLLIRTEREGGDRVRLTVRDAGVGIECQAMDKLFEAFYTTKSAGMGIGLSVSRSIVERHRGRLWAESNDGPGATFAFSIPRGPECVSGSSPVATGS